MIHPVAALARYRRRWSGYRWRTAGSRLQTIGLRAVGRPAAESSAGGSFPESARAGGSFSMGMKIPLPTCPPQSAIWTATHNFFKWNPRSKPSFHPRTMQITTTMKQFGFLASRRQLKSVNIGRHRIDRAIADGDLLAWIHRSAWVRRVAWVRSEFPIGGLGEAPGLAAGDVPGPVVPCGWVVRWSLFGAVRRPPRTALSIRFPRANAWAGAGRSSWPRSRGVPGFG